VFIILWEKNIFLKEFFKKEQKGEKPKFCKKST